MHRPIGFVLVAACTVSGCGVGDAALVTTTDQNLEIWPEAEENLGCRIRPRTAGA